MFLYVESHVFVPASVEALPCFALGTPKQCAQDGDMLVRSSKLMLTSPILVCKCGYARTHCEFSLVGSLARVHLYLATLRASPWQTISHAHSESCEGKAIDHLVSHIIRTRPIGFAASSKAGRLREVAGRR